MATTKVKALLTLVNVFDGKELNGALHAKSYKQGVVFDLDTDLNDLDRLLELHAVTTDVEDAAEVEPSATEPVEGGPKDPADMTVAELKDELDAGNQPTGGKHDELAARLAEFRASQSA